MYFRERRTQSNQKQYQGYEEAKNQLDLLDKFKNPTYDIPMSHQPSQKSGIRQLKQMDNSFQIPKVIAFSEEKLNEEVAQMQQALDKQSQTLKRLLKEQKEIDRTQVLKRELDHLKTQVHTLHLKLPKLPQQEQLYEIKHEITSLRYSFFQQAHQSQQPIIQPPQIIYQQLPQPISQQSFLQAYSPYNQQYLHSGSQQKYHPYQYLMNPYKHPYNPDSQRDGQNSEEKRSYSNSIGKAKVKTKIKTQNSASQVSNSKRSSRHSIPLVSKGSNQKTKQSFFIENNIDFQLLKKEEKSKLRNVFNFVRLAMRWKIYCQPNKIYWRKLHKHQAQCKAIIQKTSYPVALKRIKDWCKMVLAKVDNYLSKIKEIDFINPEKPLTEKEIDQSYMQLTISTKYLMSSLLTYCTSDFMIPELKFLSYLQFFDQSSIDRGLFMSRRVLFWKENQLEMNKTQQQMIVGDLVILVQILPALMEISGSYFLIKCMVSLVQMHFMKYFDLKIVNQNPNYRLIQLNVIEYVNGKLTVKLQKVSNLEDERYILGIYDEYQFQGFFQKRPHFQDDMQKTLSEIHTNLLDALIAK
ncbi:unnamed protein product (macronuclear) [Paramecium tetraurelia]|uniref:Uncharacterized protein n=1 Tax=Paramecium tetraurelia TaxID=5888 RepID=A0C9C3_PARTE|nr:uncharacterized protein GSPATT00006696001 [Paramecium tetraurelia]CAK67390.1 unnamed protein product [Paramecium tetraurelia]|eukprot:XP_001434787.1 hypothetical protein (macronuclear) [Paramecium tetraurelia strain d4-2]